MPDYLDDPFSSPGAVQLAAWSLRAASSGVMNFLVLSDAHLFALMYASCAGSCAPPEQLETSGQMADQSKTEALLAVFKDLQRALGEQAGGRFAQLYLRGMLLHEQYENEHPRLRELLGEWGESAQAEVNRVLTGTESNLDRLSKLLGLSELESRLLLFTLYRGSPGFHAFFDTLLRNEHMRTIALSSLLDCTHEQLMSAVEEESVLTRSGLLSVQQRPFRLESPSPHLRSTLSEPAGDDQSFFHRFLRPSRAAASTGSLGRLDQQDREILLRLLRLPLEELGERSSGLHALVYGPRSVDKRDMLAHLLEEEGLEGWEVVSKNVPSSDLPAWAFVAQRWLQRERPQAILMVERADQALASRAQDSLFMILGMSDPENMGELERASDAGLTDRRIRCLWLSDRPGFLTERNLGRFIFHCEVRPGSRADRRSRISQVITEFGLSQGLEHELAKYSLLGEQQVRQAASLASLVAQEQEEREGVIRRAVSQSQKALGREQTEQLRDSITAYSLENLNLSGRFTPQQVLKALQRRPQGSLCFYGLPGAGKTQLAEYLAVELDLPLLMKRASDLLSKWVGDNEQNIAAMFQEAEAEGAILFLDEADSFLRDRSLARAEYSVSLTNEILQQMERFKGVFIVATNLMDQLDPASLRRFTFRLEFLSLTPGQAWNMFCVESGFKPSQSKRALQLQDELKQIRNLTPGDFATVKRQVFILDEQFTPEQWLEQLRVEAKAKMVGLERHGIGFST